MQVSAVEELVQVWNLQSEPRSSPWAEGEGRKRSWSWSDHVEEKKEGAVDRLPIVSLLKPSLFGLRTLCMLSLMSEKCLCWSLVRTYRAQLHLRYRNSIKGDSEDAAGVQLS